MKLLIVSGLSGSGKSVALHTLEDIGYYCIDNLPAGLLTALAEQLRAEPVVADHFAVGIDARNQPGQLARFGSILKELKERGVTSETLFLQADEQTLLKRFSETRRKHPLTGPDVSLADAIAEERKLLNAIAISADLQIDTSHTNVHQLRDLIRERLAGREEQQLSLLFQSFGFKHGVPHDVDFVFDARCLPNPHWDPELRPLTGRDAAVADFLGGEPLVQEMINDLTQLLGNWIPRFEQDNRSYLTVAIGCTGGQHRSVFLTEHLADCFRDRYPNVAVRHRELS